MPTPVKIPQLSLPRSTNSPRGQPPRAYHPRSGLPRSRSGHHSRSSRPPNNHGGNLKASKSLHLLAPVNATNPAMTTICNCLISLCCLLPGPEGRGVQVGLCPRISTEHAGQRRKRKREKMKRWEEILERESSSTGLSSSRENSPIAASTTARKLGDLG